MERFLCLGVKENSSLRDAKGRIVNAKTPKENGSAAPSSQSASNTAQRSWANALHCWCVRVIINDIRIKGHYGYRLIFSAEATSIAFFQLMVNVGFAALLGAILATITPKIVRGVRELPRWAWQGIAGIVVIAPCLA